MARSKITVSMPIAIILMVVCTWVAGKVNANIGMFIGFISAAYIIFMYVIGTMLRKMSMKGESNESK